MKKKFVALLSTIIITTAFAYAKTDLNLSDAIKLYKSGNYSQCYAELSKIIKEDPANALAYYYMAITSAQIGRKDEAIANYDRVINLIPYNNNLTRYAKKGKRCLETPDKCQNTVFENLEDEFIQNKKGNIFSDKVLNETEKLKIENLKREINRSKDIAPEQFKEFRDFSAVPSNDEIVAAMRVLQNAGLSGFVNNNSDLSFLNGFSQENQLFNMSGQNTLSPQVIQALFMNNMSQGF